ncbi:hypothetical protein NDA13_005573 [Ustilago tritici]|nr:hypothetical protein NDA13_005573 [Ustilago tritici]
MTLSGSFWNFWSHTSQAPPKPRRRTAVLTEQYVETIGGGSKDAFSTPPCFDPAIGDPRLPVELTVHIVLLAAREIALESQGDDSDASASQRLLDLARVNRVCHRAILSTFLLPNLTLYGMHQIRAFAISLDKDRLGTRALARSRVDTLTLRAPSLASLKEGYKRALFDASQAQSHFEKDLIPFIRILLRHCTSIKALHLEGVPHGLTGPLHAISWQLKEFACLIGHYGRDLKQDFWLPDRWTSLTELQLHGPQFRLTPTTACALASLPRLKKLALIVPVIITCPTNLPPESMDTWLGRDSKLGINPLQILIDRSTSLEYLLLVGHGERDYVGNTAKDRMWLSNLRFPLTNSERKVRLELVTAIRRYERSSDDEVGQARTRVHPCEVSAWMMGCVRRGLHWFENEQGVRGGRGKEELDHWVETFELLDRGPSTTATSAMMSRTGSNNTPARRTQQQQQRVNEAIDAVDMLSDDDEGSSDEA